MKGEAASSKPGTQLARLQQRAKDLNKPSPVQQYAWYSLRLEI
jgi:hypothetical protein